MDFAHRLERLRGSKPATFVQKFMDDRALSLASLLSWGMLNTFLPLLLSVLSLVGLMMGDSAEVTAIEQQLLAILPAQAREAVSQSVQAFQQAAGAASLIGLGFLLFNGSNFFVSLESVFDLAYHVRERNLIKQRLVSFAGLFVVTALVFLTTGAAAVAGVFGDRVAARLPRFGPVAVESIASALSVLGLLATLLLMYWLIPNKRLSLRQAAPGAVVAAGLFLLLFSLFPYYVVLFGGGFSLFAAFGTVLLFMFWLYLVGVVLIGGAELNAFLEDPERSVMLSSVAARASIGELEMPGVHDASTTQVAAGGASTPAP